MGNLEEDDLLKTRRFVQGNDEAAWVKVWNAEYGELSGMRKMTVEEMRALERAPDFDPEGRFIVELDGQPVGIVHAYVDKLREEKKGFVRAFGVIPEFRGREVEEKLAQTAIRELKKHEMEIVQAGTVEGRGDMARLWEGLGFKLVRTFSLMKRDLDELPTSVGENTKVVMTPLRRDSDEDLRMLNWLDNECFKEHFNYRPTPVDRTVYFVREDTFFKDQEWFFALLGGQHAGYVGAGIDEKYNLEKNARTGWIMDIGVLKAYRRQGIGTRLMLQGMGRLKAKGMTSVMLGVDDWNVTKAIKLYEKVGFKVSEKDFAYEKSLK